MLAAPYLLAMPVVALSITVLAFNFLGDAIRDALDPTLRGGSLRSLRKREETPRMWGLLFCPSTG